MKISKLFADQLARIHFGVADKKKLSKSTFTAASEYAYLVGAVKTLFAVLEEERVEPFESKEEMHGFLQERYQEVAEALRVKYFYKSMSKFTLEEVIEHGQAHDKHFREKARRVKRDTGE